VLRAVQGFEAAKVVGDAVRRLKTAFYTRTATVYERELWKMEKETFKKFDEAETTLHAAIVESLSQGTIRTINTQHPARISSLTALQLVEVMHTLYSTPTLQDITTVDNDLKRPLAHFEDFLDHVTDHMNKYESLRSFNQPVSNITKIETFKESIKRWPQFDTLIATWEIDNNNALVRDFAQFSDYFVNQYGNLPTDVKPRGGNAYNVRQSGKPKGKGKGKGEKGKGKHGKGKGKYDKGKGRGVGRFVYWRDADDILSHKRPHNEHQVSSAVHDLVDDSAEQQEDSVFIHSRTSARSSASAAHQVHGSNASSPLTSSMSNLDPKLYFYCHYHGWNLSHAGPDCRVMSNDAAIVRTSPKAGHIPRGHHTQGQRPNRTNTDRRPQTSLPQSMEDLQQLTTVNRDLPVPDTRDLPVSCATTEGVQNNSNAISGCRTQSLFHLLSCRHIHIRQRGNRYPY
jgi:hypothetical protein